MNNRSEFINSSKLQVQENILLSIFSKEDNIVIFDIGACEGESSIRYSNLFPNSAIYTFEPIPENFEFVNQNIALYKKDNIFPYKICLSDKIGETTFYISNGNPDNIESTDWNYGNKSSSLLAPEETTQVVEWLKFENKINITTTTLINFCNMHKIVDIDFIHMDVQGAELMVLDGASTFINNIKCIWLEVATIELYKNQPLKSDIEQYMEKHGFVKITDTVYEYDGDQFWIKKDFVEKEKLWIHITIIQIKSTIRKIYKKFRRKYFNKLLQKIKK